MTATADHTCAPRENSTAPRKEGWRSIGDLAAEMAAALEKKAAGK